MKKVQDFLKISLLLLANLALIGAIFIGWRAWRASEALQVELQGSLTALRSSAISAEKLIGTYSEELSSERNQKALSASLAAAASWQATARLVNTQLIPEAENSLQEISATNRAVQRLLDSQNSELSLTQQQSRRTLGALEEQIVGIGPEISRLTSSSAETVESLRQPIGELNKSAEEVTRILKNLETASQSAPGMAQSLDKILTSGSRWQRPISIATLLIALLGAIR